MLGSTSKILEDSAKGGFYLTVGNLISGLVSALSLIIIARVLGPAEYGIYTISTIIPSLLILFVDPGISQALIKYSANLRMKREDKRLRKLLISGLSVKSALAFVLFLVCLAFADQFANHILNRSEISELVRLTSVLIILQTFLTTVNSIFIGLDKMEYVAFTNVVQSSSKAVLSPLLVLLGFGVVGAITGYLVSFALACLIGAILFTFKIYRSLNRPGTDPADFSENLKMLLAYGLPLYVSVLIGGFTVQFRGILLSNFTLDYDVGNFQAAMNLNMIVASVAEPIATVLVPAFSKLEDREGTLREFFKTSVKYSSLVVLPIAVLLISFSNEIVEIVYGEGYGLASSILAIYMTIYLFSGLGMLVLGSFFNGLGQTRINLMVRVANSAVLLATAPLLTYHFKTYGMVVALLLSSTAGTLYGFYRARKSFRISLNWGKLAKIYISSITSALPLFAIKAVPLPSILSVTLGAIAYLAIYLLMVPATKALTMLELKELKAILGNVEILRILAYPLIFCEEKIMAHVN